MVAAAAICALAAALIFVNLDRSLLWQDEAQTALLARTTLQHGYRDVDQPRNLAKSVTVE